MPKNRHKITFIDEADAQILALAEMGEATSGIIDDGNMTEGQINYRLAKAKKFDPAFAKLRQKWRSGKSEFFQKIRRDHLAIRILEIQRRLPKKIVHISTANLDKTT